MSDPHAIDRQIDRSHMQVSDEVAIQITGMNKWYGTLPRAARHQPDGATAASASSSAGPSGSGKSTLIRCINRLEEHQQGQIIVDGTELTIRPQEHRQGALRGRDGVPALQPVPASDDPGEPARWHRSGCARCPKKEAEETAMHFLRKVKIPEQALKYPGQLSGGQQQRVAIARVAVHEARRSCSSTSRPRRSTPR